MAHKIKVVRINQLSPTEFDIIQEGGKLDAHVRWEDRVWVLDVFQGNSHVEAVEVGKKKESPYWRQILAYFEI